MSFKLITLRYFGNIDTRDKTQLMNQVLMFQIVHVSSGNCNFTSDRSGDVLIIDMILFLVFLFIIRNIRQKKNYIIEL